MFHERRAADKRCLILVALVFLFAGFAPGSRAGITHRYSFNDGTANDSFGNANGTLVNGASVSNGKLVLANDGTNGNPATGQYVALPTNILCTRNFTLEVWFTFNGGKVWQRLLDLGNSIGGQGHGFIILTLDSQHVPLGQISINSWGDYSDTDYVYGNNPFPVGGEHCLVYIHNLDVRLEQLYLDGVKIGSTSAKVDPSTTYYTNFWIGRSQFLADPFYNGSIDELRTYDNALSPAQVLASFQAGPNVLGPDWAPKLTIKPSGNATLVSWPSSWTSWTLQQNSDLTTTNWSDSAGISNNGTNKNLTISSSTGNLFFRLSHP